MQSGKNRYGNTTAVVMKTNQYSNNNNNSNKNNNNNNNKFDSRCNRNSANNRDSGKSSYKREQHTFISKNDDDSDDDNDAPPVALNARFMGEADEVVTAHNRNSKTGRLGNEKWKTNTKKAFSPHELQQSTKQTYSHAGRYYEHLETSNVDLIHSRDGNVKELHGSVQEEAKTSASKMLTVLNDKETELPQKLNTKVFVDGLPYRYDPEPGQPSLEDELAQFASAWKVGKVIRLIKKPGYGFGFLVFKSPNSVPVAIKILHGRKFLGRPLRVALPKPRDLEAMNDVAGMKDMGKTSFKRQVLLSDLPKVCQPEILREVLRDVAPQLESKLETIKMTSRNRKAFLTFASETEVPAALQFLNGFNLLGRKIAAVPAAPPGSLPYSHTHLNSVNTAAVNNAEGNYEGTTAATLSKSMSKPTSYSIVETQDSNNEESAIVPLGVEVTTSEKVRQRASHATNKQLAQKQELSLLHIHKNNPSNSNANTSTSISSSSSSNITGRTDKYNLLDNGPSEVYVGNLNDSVTVHDLRVHFASCGKINNVELIAHPETHLPLGIARITFAIPAYAAYAVSKLHGSRLHDCVIRVDRGEESSAPLSHERQSKLDSLLEHATSVANKKKAININAIDKHNSDTDDDDNQVDEIGFMAHHGIHDPVNYFKDTTVHFSSLGLHSNINKETKGNTKHLTQKLELQNAKERNPSKLKRQHTYDDESNKKDAEEITVRRGQKMSKLEHTNRGNKSHLTTIDDDDDADDDDSHNNSHIVEQEDNSNSKYDKVALANMLASDSDSEEEEHFIDVDTITPSASRKTQKESSSNIKRSNSKNKITKNVNVTKNKSNKEQKISKKSAKLNTSASHNSKSSLATLKIARAHETGELRSKENLINLVEA